MSDKKLGSLFPAIDAAVKWYSEHRATLKLVLSEIEIDKAKETIELIKGLLKK